MSTNPDLLVLVGTVGGDKLTSGTGALIRKNLTSIANQISKQKLVNITIGLNQRETASQLKTQLNNLARNISVTVPYSLQTSGTQAPSHASGAAQPVQTPGAASDGAGAQMEKFFSNLSTQLNNLSSRLAQPSASKTSGGPPGVFDIISKTTSAIGYLEKLKSTLGASSTAAKQLDISLLSVVNASNTAAQTSGASFSSVADTGTAAAQTLGTTYSSVIDAGSTAAQTLGTTYSSVIDAGNTAAQTLGTTYSSVIDAGSIATQALGDSVSSVTNAGAIAAQTLGDSVSSVANVSSASVEAVGASLVSITESGGASASKFATVFSSVANTVTSLMGWISIVGVAISAVIQIVDAFTVSLEEQEQMAQELAQKYQQTQSELQTLNQELATTKARIEELQKLEAEGTLTVAQAEDLEELKKTNDELERSIRLKEREAEQQKEESGEAALETYNKRKYQSKVDLSVATTGDIIYQYVDPVTAIEERKRAIESLQESLEQLNEDYANPDSGLSFEAYSDRFDVITQSIKDNKTEITGIMTDISTDLENMPEGQVKLDVGAAVDGALDFLDEVKTITKSVPKIAAATQKTTHSLEEMGTETKAAAEALDLLSNNDTPERISKTAADLLTLDAANESVSKSAQLVAAAQKEMSVTGELSLATIESLKASGFSNYLIQTENGYRLSENALNDYLETQRLEYEFAYNSAQQAAQQLLESEFSKQLGYQSTTESIYEQLKAAKALAQVKMREIESSAPDRGSMYSQAQWVYQQEDYKKLAAFSESADAALAEQERTQKNRSNFLQSLPQKSPANSGGGGSGVDTWKAQFDKQYQYHKHLVAMEQETQASFLNWLSGSEGYKKYFENNEKYLNEFRQYSEEVFTGLRQLMEDSLDTSAHKISIWESEGGHESDIVAEYKHMSEMVSAEVTRINQQLLDAGMSPEEIDASKTLQDLTEKLQSYKTAIHDVKASVISDTLEIAKHQIDLWENQGGQEETIIAKYQEMMHFVEDQAKEYRKEGYSEDSEEIRNLQNQWWEFYNTIQETRAATVASVLDRDKHQISLWENQSGQEENIIAKYQEMMHFVEDRAKEYRNDSYSEDSEEIRNLQNQWWEFYNAMQEAREATVTNVFERGKHQISLWEKQGGQEKNIIAKYTEMMDYAHSRAEALRAGMRAQGMSEADIEASSQIRELQNLWWEFYNAMQDATQGQLDSLNALLDLTKDMVRQEKEDMIDALESQKDAYAKIIDMKKRSLELTERERSYSENVDDKTKDISKLQARIDALSLDDSRSAQLERGALLEELAEKQKDLDELQHDHSIDLQMDALDQEQKDFEDAQDAKIREIRTFLDDNEALTKAAMDRIKTEGDLLYSSLQVYAQRYTSTSSADLQAMWQSAQRAAESYGDYLSSLAGLTAEVERGQNGVLSDKTRQSLIAQMQNNSQTYSGASAEKRKELDASNSKLAKQVNATRDDFGYWWNADNTLLYGSDYYSEEQIKALMQKYAAAWKATTDETLRRLYAERTNQIGQSIGAERNTDGVWFKGGVQLYHSGGIVGGAAVATLKQNEVMAKLEEGEIVMSQKHQENFLNYIRSTTPKFNFTSLLSSLPGLGALLSGGGNKQEIHVDNSIYFDGYLPDGHVLNAIKRQQRKAAEIIAGAAVGL